MESPVPSWPRRHALGILAAVPLGPAILGSIFNIWYNVIHVRPLLEAGQEERFHRAITLYNAAVYPLGIAVWLWLVFSVAPAYRVMVRGQAVDGPVLQRARARAVNLPWHFALVLGIGWFGCIPAFLWALSRDPRPVHPDLPMHLSISIVIAALITITHGIMVVELLSHRLLYPVLFRDAQPFRTPGALPISLRRRGLLWAVSAGACPIASLLLLAMVESRPHEQDRWFALSVGLLGIAFGLVSAGLMSRLVVRPVEVLRDASSAVAAGDLSVRVGLLRADEFGPLVDEFNHMVGEMRTKQRLHETFGLHVGRRAAEQILARDPGLGGRRQTVTVMFCDIRGFTARCGRQSPEEVVALLNGFFTAMVRIVEEEHGGMVNKFLGDGFLAVLNAAGDQPRHARSAVEAGLGMLRELDRLNAGHGCEPGAGLAIGIGIHTGEAIIGNIGSAQRLEYTAIGDTVNLAARIESLTKALGEPLLLSETTRRGLPPEAALRALPAQSVQGVEERIAVFAPADTAAATPPQPARVT